MSKISGSTSPEQERQRLERICAVLVKAFEAHPETRDADRFEISLDNHRGVVLDEYDDAGELWTASRVAAHHAFGVLFIYAHADELGAIRLGAGPRPRIRFDLAVVRERWARVNALSPETRTRRRRPSTRLRAVPNLELLEYESDDRRGLRTSCASSTLLGQRRGYST